MVEEGPMFSQSKRNQRVDFVRSSWLRLFYSPRKYQDVPWSQTTILVDTNEARDSSLCVRMRYIQKGQSWLHEAGRIVLASEQSQTWSNARDSRQHKCRSMLKLTKWINVAISCGPYLPHGASVEFFTLSWVVERWNLSSVSLLLSLFLKSIRENMIPMILWFLNIRHSGTLFGMWFLTSAQQIFLFILPSKG